MAGDKKSEKKSGSKKGTITCERTYVSDRCSRNDIQQDGRRSSSSSPPNSPIALRVLDVPCRHQRRGAVREKRPVSLYMPRPAYQRVDNAYVETPFLDGAASIQMQQHWNQQQKQQLKEQQKQKKKQQKVAALFSSIIAENAEFTAASVKFVNDRQPSCSTDLSAMKWSDVPPPRTGEGVIQEFPAYVPWKAQQSEKLDSCNVCYKCRCSMCQMQCRHPGLRVCGKVDVRALCDKEFVDATVACLPFLEKTPRCKSANAARARAAKIAKEAPAKTTSAAASPAKTATAETAPAKTASTTAVPVKTAPAKIANTETAFANTATAAKTATAEIAIKEAAPTKTASAAAAPEKTATTETAPAKTATTAAAPVKTATAETAFAKTAPIAKIATAETVPTKTASAVAAPEKTALAAKTATTEIAIAETAIKEAAPTKTASAAATPAKTVPADAVAAAKQVNGAYHDEDVRSVSSGKCWLRWLLCCLCSPCPPCHMADEPLECAAGCRGNYYVQGCKCVDWSMIKRNNRSRNNLFTTAVSTTRDLRRCRDYYITALPNADRKKSIFRRILCI